MVAMLSTRIPRADRTSSMKAVRFFAAVVLTSISLGANAGKLCFQDRLVVSVNTGYVDLPFGADGGDAVYFTLDDGAYFPLNNGFNLDWPRGQALHRVLLMALAGRYRVTGYDHYGYGGTCDDIDELVIRR
jgi:hypothetical protein